MIAADRTPSPAPGPDGATAIGHEVDTPHGGQWPGRRPVGHLQVLDRQRHRSPPSAREIRFTDSTVAAIVNPGIVHTHHDVAR